MPAELKRFSCKHCGKKFRRVVTEYSAIPLFCSKSCKSQWQADRRTVRQVMESYTCIHCGKSFDRFKRKTPYKFCSTRCAGRFMKTKCLPRSIADLTGMTKIPPRR